MVESGRNVALSDFHKLAGGRVGWREMAAYLIRSSLALTLLWPVHRDKTVENKYPYIHYMQFLRWVNVRLIQLNISQVLKNNVNEHRNLTTQ